MDLLIGQPVNRAARLGELLGRNVFATARSPLASGVKTAMVVSLRLYRLVPLQHGEPSGHILT